MKTILLVEDDPLLSLAESRQLKARGYRVVTAQDGPSAILACQEDPQGIDLVLMDIDLGPGMDGTEAALRIQGCCEVPILFLSSHTEPDIVERTEKISSYGYVVKSSSPTVLDASIKMAFKLQEATRSLVFHELRYRRLFECAQDGILILDALTGRIVDVNPFLVRLLGYSKEAFLGKSLWDIGAFANVAYSRQLFLELQEKDYVRYHDMPLQTAAGLLIHVEFVSNVYLVNGERVIQCNIRDIAERMCHEKELTDEAKEKEALLRELQHRTKNSFTMITAMMVLRSSVTESVETKAVLEELTMRVASISDLYTLLYDTDSFFVVPLGTYCGKVLASMGNFTQRAAIRSTLADPPVSAKEAAVVGMVLVELVTNALKYAFPEGRQGTLGIDLRQEGVDLVLEVTDDGVGLPPGFDPKALKSMGLHLALLMAKQLGGSLGLASNGGSRVTLRWPLPSDPTNLAPSALLFPGTGPDLGKGGMP